MQATNYTELLELVSSLQEGNMIEVSYEAGWHDMSQKEVSGTVESVRVRDETNTGMTVRLKISVGFKLYEWSCRKSHPDGIRGYVWNQYESKRHGTGVHVKGDSSNTTVTL